jgi:hypothetical protein
MSLSKFSYVYSSYIDYKIRIPRPLLYALKDAYYLFFECHVTKLLIWFPDGHASCVEILAGVTHNIVATRNVHSNTVVKMVQSRLSMKETYPHSLFRQILGEIIRWLTLMHMNSMHHRGTVSLSDRHSSYFLGLFNIINNLSFIYIIECLILISIEL